MRRKECEYCENGTMPVAIVLVDDEICDVQYADYCPMCGRCLKEI